MNTTELLDKLEQTFSKLFNTVTIDKQTCFVGQSGAVFFFIILEQLHGLIVEYADSLEDAHAGRFDDGDLIDVDRGFDFIVGAIKEELLCEKV